MAVLNPNLRGFYETKGVRNFVLYGGRASSKTYHTAAFCVYIAQAFSVKFLCTRQFQNRTQDSVKTVIEEIILTLGMSNDFIITDYTIRHRRTGSEFRFLGIQRNLREIKGIANVDILWIEEAEDLTEAQWEVLEPTIRAEHSKIFIVFNPRYATDFVYKRFVTSPPRGTLVRKINYDENPYLSSTMRDIIEAAQAEDPDQYKHIYLGEPLADDDNSVIKRSHIMAAIDAHTRLGIDPAGWKRLGFDVADGGKDKCALVYAYGQLASWSDQWKAQEHELLKSSKRAWNEAGARSAMLIYDSIGVGAQVGAKVNELNETDEYERPSGYTVRHAGFNAGGEVWRPDSKYGMTKKTNREMFSNIKAQAWWHVSDLFRNTFRAIEALEAAGRGEIVPPLNIDPANMIFIDPTMPHLMELVDELATPNRDFDNAGRVKVESKKELSKASREGGPVPSPNLADAFVMAFAPGQRPMTISAEAVEEVY